MTLDQLVAQGAYLNAGHLDIYLDHVGKHVRLGDVTAGGDLVLSLEGEQYTRLQEALDPVNALQVPGPSEEDMAVAQAEHERLAAEVAAQVAAQVESERLAAEQAEAEAAK